MTGGTISGGNISEENISGGGISGGNISEENISGGGISGGNISEENISGGSIPEGNISRETILQALDIDKSFGGVPVLKHVNLDIRKGEVHALMGENGAGKSTLIKIITGAYSKDSGQLKWKGNNVEINSRSDCQALGISCVYQELSVIPALTVAQNVLLGKEPRIGKTHLIDHKKMNAMVQELIDRYEFPLNPMDFVNDLGIGQRQLVEILKGLSSDADLLIMDEPTASLSGREAEILFSIIEALRDKGVSIIYISHRLDEVMRLCDDITILRDGETIQTAPTSQMDSDKLINLMVNRQIKVNTTRTRKSSIGETVLSVKGLSKKGVLRDVSFEVHKGEILGMFGLVGAGRTEAVRAMLGVDRYDTAEIRLDSKPVVFKNIGQALAAGVALVPEERRKQGILPNTPIYKNVSICNLKALSRLGLIDKKKELEYAKHCTEILGVACSSVFQNVGNLSGGNQQKVVISKYIDRNIRVLILDEPTRGIDVGAKDQIYEIIEGLAQQGMAVIVISSEIPELQLMCDRICVMSQGKVTTVIDRSEFADSDNILRNAIGI